MRGTASPASSPIHFYEQAFHATEHGRVETRNGQRTRFHDLRHAHATQLLSAGVHVKAVSERLGHSSTSFTMDTYSAVIPSMGRTAADAADQLFG